MVYLCSGLLLLRGCSMLTGCRVLILVDRPVRRLLHVILVVTERVLVWSGVIEGVLETLLVWKVLSQQC